VAPTIPVRSLFFADTLPAVADGVVDMVIL
jgi:hypothetical protein